MTMRLLTLVLCVALIGAACGEYQSAGTPLDLPVDAAVVEARARRQDATRLALAEGGAESERQFAQDAKQILFGDLHVHTTFSMDAFAMALPAMQGQGVHPLADACDFARYCSDLDFFSINDHAENLTLPLWQETKRSIRECNAAAPDTENPDLVAFLGWEWSQLGLTPETHYGHRNVILYDTEEDKVPTRPINARNVVTTASMATKTPLSEKLKLLTADTETLPYLVDLAFLQNQVTDTPICPDGVPVRDLPAACMETAATPDVLFRKLDDWGFDAIVIPHGLTWGIHTPYGPTWDKQLSPSMHDPDRQILLEIYSGHGNGEEFRPWRGVVYDANGVAQCPEATPEYTPCCRRAAEIIRARCPDPTSPECDARSEEAVRLFLDAGVYGDSTVPGATAADWKDCGYCRDCFLPPFLHVPDNSAQRLLALTAFGDGDPLRFHFGFIAASDNHSARPGTGYKEVARLAMSDARGPRNQEVIDTAFGSMPPEARSYPLDEARRRKGGISTLPDWDLERQASFFMTGGLTAVHAEGRDRKAIWDALQRREVYGTSGDRILLWFDLLNGPGGLAPMGAEVRLGETPRFRVRAAGAFEQAPGCPSHSQEALGGERVEFMCRGECYNPTDRRRAITRIEVVRIRPQARADEDVASLIEDPWKRIECPGEIDGCVVEFEDPDYATAGREALYYVRAIQAPSPAINGGGLRCVYDDAGRCERVEPCYGDYRTPASDDCLSMVEERAWSSPIRVTP